MTQNLGHVFKKNQVKFSGTCRLDSGPAATMHTPQTAAGQACQPQVRIVDNNEQGVVLEFTCSCGQKTYIQCDHAQ